jgi:elongator complex protein 6
LTLLTSILNASANWLVLRFIFAVLRDQTAHDEDGGEVRVILVSWLRDWEGWRGGGRRMGIDFQKGDKVTFVHGLGERMGIRDGGIEAVEKEITAAIANAKAQGCRVQLVLDGLDFLLAATSTGTMEMLDMVYELREVESPFSDETFVKQAADGILQQHVHATIVTASADYPLMQARNTPLEVDHAAFVMGLAHQASVIMGLRGLDTGVARDVSGVLRITRGGDDRDEVEEKEILYFVGGDGSVRVFERGA